MNDLISVIIPVYNVAPYLPCCLDSVINQTYKDLEIILIDDGSTDKSGVICDEYASRDNRIKVIHKKNGGLSSARNTGLDNAHGCFVAFLDSDDFIHHKMYEVLYNLLKETGSDIATCGTICFVDENNLNIVNQEQASSIHIRNKQEVYRDLLYDEKNIRIEVWNKLYKKSLIGDIRFKIGQIYEDIYFERMLLRNLKQMVTTDSCYHYYRTSRPGNTSSSFKESKLSMFTELNDFIEELINIGHIDIASLYVSDAQVSCINMYIAAYEHKMSKEILSKIYNWFVYFRSIVKADQKQNLRFLVFGSSPKLYFWLRKVRNLIKK